MTRPVARRTPHGVFVLSFPPPYHGVNFVNLAIRDSGLLARFDAAVVDLSDHRNQENLGRLDVVNVLLGVRAVVQLARTLRGKRSDFVYLVVSPNTMAFARDALLILAARAFSDAQVIAHLHVDGFDRFVASKGAILRRVIRYVLGKVDAGIVLGDSLRRNWEPWVRRLHVVPNGTDVGSHVDLGTKLARRDRTITILYLSTLMVSKGILDVLRALPDVLARFPGAKLKAAGAWTSDPETGVTADEAHRVADQLVSEGGLADAVDFLGPVGPAVRDRLLEQGDVFVLPTTWPEAQPLSILEAMAAGCVVIATAQGAIAETVIDGTTGFVIPPQRPDVLAARILALAEDPELRCRMAQAARERYETLYTAQRYTNRLASVFDAVLDHAPV